MAVNSVRPFPVQWNRTSCSLPSGDLDACGPNARSPDPKSKSIWSRPARAQSALNLKCDAKISTRYVNGQITPTSPQPFPERYDSWSYLSLPSDSSSVHSRSVEKSSFSSLGQDGLVSTDGKFLKLAESLSPEIDALRSTLRSPIKFEVEARCRQIDQWTDPEFQTCPECVDDNIDDEVLSFNSSDWELNKPRRRLSYGAPLESVEDTTASCRTVDPQTSRSPSTKPSIEWSCDSRCNDAIQTNVSRAYYSEPTGKKSRLWLDLLDEASDDTIEEAQATTVTSSPTKPRVIEISRRRPVAVSTPRTPPSSSRTMCFLSGSSYGVPETPPPSPVSAPCRKPQQRMIESAPFPAIGYGIESTPLLENAAVAREIKSKDSKKHRKQREAFNRIKGRSTWSAAAPSLGPILVPDTNTIRRVGLSTSDFRPPTPTPIVEKDFKLGELQVWILCELESALAQPSSRPLQLDCPVIRQVSLPAKERRIPTATQTILPHSVYSPGWQPLRNSQDPAMFSCRTSTNSPSSSSETITLNILQRIFPQTSRSALSNLVSINLALNYVAGIHIPSHLLHPFNLKPPSYNPALPKPPPYRSDFLPCSVTISHDNIPSKARAMLGLPPSPSRPPLPAFWRKAEQREWAERILELEEALRDESRRIMDQIFPSTEKADGRGDEMMDALARAVIEVARIDTAPADRYRTDNESPSPWVAVSV